MRVESLDASAELAPKRSKVVKVATPKPIVLKFGSSVLRDVSDLKDVVSEIYRYTRVGRKVVAVVSAFAGETDQLYEEAAALGASKQSRHAPRLIALGEDRSAALLAIACDESGLHVRIAGARLLSLRAGGPVDDAHPQTIDEHALRSALKEHDVVIVPGFVAIGATGEPVLLGRGGSDLTAVCLAHGLDLDDVTLVKDVDGVYDLDPATAGDSAKRFHSLDWATAGEVAGKLLQPKSIEFAEKRKVAINVRRLGDEQGTRVAADTAPPSAPRQAEPLRVGVAGLGLIGAGVAKRVAQNELQFVDAGALVRDIKKNREEGLEEARVFDAHEKFLAENPDIVVDALPSKDAGETLIENALSCGISIVSANKQAVAGSLKRFHELAAENGAEFYYSASVGGGAPLVETVRLAAAHGRVQSASGILNGTVNFILTAMKNGRSFDDAVKQAQDAGFAEPDPAADLSGEDAKAKISILCYEAFGREPDQSTIKVEALTQARAEKIAAQGGVWKQLAEFSEDDEGNIAASVTFQRVGDDPLFNRSLGEDNAIRVTNYNGDCFESRGKGAGRRPTVESLLADLGEFRRSQRI